MRADAEQEKPVCRSMPAAASAAPTGPLVSDQLRRQLDGDACERPRDRAVLLGALRLLRELCGVDTRHGGFGLQLHRVDRPAAVALLEVDFCRGVDALDGEAGPTQLKGERHGKTSGMGGTEQLLRIGPLA